MFDGLIWRIRCALHVLAGRPLIYRCEFNTGFYLNDVNSRVWIVENFFNYEGDMSELPTVQGVRNAI